jgi:RND superfamily putative drug exporter
LKNLIIPLIKYKSPVFFIWIIIFIFSGLNLLFNKNHFETGIGEIKNSISKTVSDEIRANYKEAFSSNLMFTFSSDKYSLADGKFRIYLNDFEKSLQKDRNIVQTYSVLDSPLTNIVSKDKKATLVFLKLKNPDFSFAESYTPHLREISRIFLNEKKALDNTLKVYLTGNGPYSYDMNQISEIDGQKAEQKVLILTFIILIFAFRSIGASLIAVISGFMASVITISCLKIITGFYPLSVFCQNISTMIGLALGIDYSLLLITRYREERKEKDKMTAISATIEHAGTAVLYSGITVFIGFSALFLPGLNVTASLGVGGGLVVFFSLLAALTFTPVLLYTFEKYLDYPKFLSDFFITKNFDLQKKWAAFITKRGNIAGVITLIILILLSIPVFSIKLAEPEIRSMPDSMEAKQGFEKLQELSSGRSLFPIFILVKANDKQNITDNKNFSGLYRFTEQLKTDKRIGKVYGLTSIIDNLDLFTYFLLFNSGINNPDFSFAKDFLLSRDQKSTLIQVFPVKTVDSYTLNILVDDLRKLNIPGFDILVGGPASVNYDLVIKLYSKFPLIIGFIYLVTVILLAKGFRSILIPLKAIILNTISVSASFGILVMVFQYGYFQNLIGITNSPHSIVSAIPVILFCIMFSLSMDYEVFLMSRIYEEYIKTGDNEKSIIKGLAETGGVITKAALIMIIVFGAFTQADIVIIKMTGLGLATAVLLDATLIRMILVPVFMKLAGKANWYFPFKK